MRPIRGSISLPSFAPKFQSSLLGFFLVVGERCVGFVMTTLSLAAPFAFAHVWSFPILWFFRLNNYSRFVRIFLSSILFKLRSFLKLDCEHFPFFLSIIAFSCYLLLIYSKIIIWIRYVSLAVGMGNFGLPEFNIYPWWITALHLIML